VIEQVDEPRAEKPEETALQTEMFATDARGRQLKGWTNKLIWGDNKLILSSLKNGRSARKSRSRAASSSSTLTLPLTLAPISAWTSRSAATRSRRSPTS